MKNLTALIVDDEPVNGRLYQAILKMENMHALTLSDSRDAVTLYTMIHPDIDIVLMDVSMPHLDGAQCLSAMRRMNPSIRCIAITGHLDHPSLNEMIEMGLYGIIRKPVASGEFIKTVKQSMDAKGYIQRHAQHVSHRRANIQLHPAS
jgi:DNA-binding NtrC family response regulator